MPPAVLKIESFKYTCSVNSEPSPSVPIAWRGCRNPCECWGDVYPNVNI